MSVKQTYRDANIRQTTYCSGIWKSPGHEQGARAYYLESLKWLLKAIAGGKLFFFFDEDETFQACLGLARKHNVTVHGHRIEISGLPYSQFGGRLLEACKRMDGSKYLTDPAYARDKGVRHHNDEFLRMGEEAYARLMSIRISKLALVSGIACEQDPFGSDFFAWADASVGRYRYARESSDFTTSVMDINRMNFYGGDSYYQGSKLKLNSSFLCGGKEAWREFSQRFNTALLRHIDDGYAHDEETIISYIQEENPNLFFSSIGEMQKGIKKKISRVLGNPLLPKTFR